MSDIFGNASSADLTDVVITDSITKGSFTITTLNNEEYNLQTPNNGVNLDVLTTDGVGNTYWAPAGGGGTPTLQEVYDASLPTAQVNISYGDRIRFTDDDSNDILLINSVSGGNSNITAEKANITIINSTTNNSDSFVKNGGTSIQYLMANGSVLTSSANSGNSNFYLYNNTNSTTNTSPIAGEVIINSAVNTTATMVYISHLTRDNVDVEVFFKFISSLNELYIQDQNLSSSYIQYNITGTPVITINNKVAVPVVYSGNSGGAGANQFGSGHNIMISFFTNTIETDQRITTLENKTQNQTANTTTTTFTGTGGIVATKYAVPSGLTSQFLKANGDLDASTYLTTTSAGATYLPLVGGTLTGALTGTSITGTSIVKSGGTSLQFLKADGTIDASTYLTTTSAGATYLPLAGGTLTGALTGTSITGTSLVSPSLDTATAVAMNIGTTNASSITLGKNGNTLTIPSQTLIGGTLSQLDVAVLNSTLFLGTNNAGTINIGRTSQILRIQSQIQFVSSSPQLDTEVLNAALSIGTTNAGTITLGRNTQILTIPSNIQITGTAPSLDCGVLNTALNIGITNAGTITLGRTGQVISIPGSISGSLTIATSVLTPLINTATAVAMNIGTATQTALTIGRNTVANTLIQGLAILQQNVPFISTTITAPVAANSRLSLSKFIMPTNLSNSTTGTFIMTGVAGSMGSVNTLANEQIVGSTWRYRFSGVAGNAAATNNLSFQITHAGGTQNVATWIYTSATTNGNFNGEIILFFSVIGATVTAFGSGYVNFVNGTTASIQNVTLNSFSPVYNSTLANTNACQIVASPATGFLYGVNNFSVEWLR